MEPAEPVSEPEQGLGVDEQDRSAYKRLTVLGVDEKWWRDHQKWLEEKGYMLRPRYRPDWKPSWLEKDTSPFDCEDGKVTLRSNLLDATRVADSKIVMLKKVHDLPNPFEVEMCRYFSTDPIASHSRNHCVPIYKILDVPGEKRLHIVVMPLLRMFDDPSFQTIGETVDFFSQIFEGLQFMHQCHVAHRDCMDLNIMMDPVPLYPNLYHPIADIFTMDFKGRAKYHTRTWRPTRYYLIDLGLSQRYDPANGPPRDIPILGGDKTVPEFRNPQQVYDPFPTDIYYLGNMIRECFLEKYEGMEFITPLVQDMVQDNPSKRPTIDEVVRRFKDIRRSLSWWKLRSRAVKKGETELTKVYKATRHAFRTVRYVLTLHSAIPSQ